MPILPPISFKTQDAVVDVSTTKTLLLVGQSNTATAGLYKGLENYSIDLVESTFGEDSHLTSLLKDVLTNFSDSIVKPKLWAVSYVDEGTAVARVLDLTVTGTSTEEKTLKIKLNSMNPDRTTAQAASILALRNTQGSSIGDFAKNNVLVGAAKNASMPFNPYLSEFKTNDVVIEVLITDGMTNAQVATAIDTAVNASTKAIYGSSVLSNVATLTANHKGSLSNYFSIELLDVADGISIAVSEDTAGSGVVDATAILDIEDDESMKLSELDFNFIVLPISYSVSALVTDAKAKWDNILQYNNRALEYFIMRGDALDFSTTTELDNLATAEPVEENGIVKQIYVSKKDGFAIRGVSDYNNRLLIEAKQFTTILRELDGRISVGNAFTLSNSTGFTNLERTITAAFIREIFAEKFLPIDFPERNYTSGTAVNEYTYSRNDVISKFQFYRDLIDGTRVNDPVFGTVYAGLVSNSEVARARYDELLDLSVSFDTATKQLIVQLINELNNPIKSLFILSSYV